MTEERLAALEQRLTRVEDIVPMVTEMHGWLQQAKGARRVIYVLAGIGMGVLTAWDHIKHIFLPR